MDQQAFAQLLGNYGEFVGAIAVVITLAYLATQIRQNTLAMEKNAEREVLNDAARWRENLIRQPEVAELYLKGLSEPESLDHMKRLRFRMILDGLFDHVGLPRRIFRTTCSPGCGEQSRKHTAMADDYEGESNVSLLLGGKYMKTPTKLGLCVIIGAMSVVATSAHAVEKFVAVLTADEEVPVVRSDGNGFFQAHVNADGSITFELHVENLTGDISAAHIHFAQRDVNGAIMVTLCGGGPAPVAGDVCEEDVSGTITPDFVGATAQVQGVAAGDLDAVIRAMRTENAYINVHTSAFPGGEIRGQVR